MDSIKNILPTVIGQMSSKEALASQDIQALWGRMCGKIGSRAVDLKDGCLTVHVDSPMRMVKLNLNKEDLIAQLNKQFPSIKRIHFKVAKI